MVVKERIPSLIYIFLGEDAVSKERKLNLIKKEIIKKETRQFNYELLFGKDIEPRNFAQTLRQIPVNSAKRLVVIKEPERLPFSSRDVLIDYLDKPSKQLVLILDSTQSKPNPFLNKVAKYARTIHFRKSRRANVFDLGRAISQRKNAYALELLLSLFARREKPIRILNGLAWFWENDRLLSVKKRTQGFPLLLSADLDIKSGNLKPHLALELLVIKLCGL